MMVRRVAVVIASSLKELGHAIDMRMVDRAAMLHDICKSDSIRAGGDHALMGEQLLAAYGYPLLGDVIGQHVRLKSMELNEAMIVNYADKRVKHDTIVSVSTRFVDLMDRYGTDEARQDRIMGHYHNTLRIENIVFEGVPIDPEWLNALNLVPGDYPLYGGDGILGEHGPVEQQNQDMDLERVYEDQPVLVDERDLLRG